MDAWSWVFKRHLSSMSRLPKGSILDIVDWVSKRDPSSLSGLPQGSILVATVAAETNLPKSE
jgi:hypothetical protein